MEIETDKATVEIEAPGSGVLTQVIAKPGDEVPVGQQIAFILAPGESLPTEVAPGAPTPPTTVPKGTAPKSTAKTPSIDSAETRAGRVLASPAAKRIAHEKGVSLASVKGSGPQGSVLAEDVLRAAPDGTTAATATLKIEQTVPLSAMRRIAGERMAQSKQSTPHFYLGMDIDMSAVNKVRTEWKQHGEDPVPSLNDFLLHACARALKDFPSLNASFAEQGIKLHSDINLGMAVALEEGLVVPVIRNADRLQLVDLAAHSRELIDKAYTKKLFPRDYEGGTFTVSGPAVGNSLTWTSPNVVGASCTNTPINMVFEVQRQ